MADLGDDDIGIGGLLEGMQDLTPMSVPSIQEEVEKSVNSILPVESKKRISSSDMKKAREAISTYLYRGLDYESGMWPASPGSGPSSRAGGRILGSSSSSPRPRPDQQKLVDDSSMTVSSSSTSLVAPVVDGISPTSGTSPRPSGHNVGTGGLPRSRSASTSSSRSGSRRGSRAASRNKAVTVPLFSPEFRPRIWQLLLGCYDQDSTAYDMWDKELDRSNQKVIRMDCDRTRPGEPFFEDDEGAMRDELEKQLTFYCKSRGVYYKQGMNEILAPLLVVYKDRPRGELANVFYAVVSRFLPSIFNDVEFESLQCIMRIFTLLLQYHDPNLCNFLNQYHIVPELYATPWFITLFSRKNQVDLVHAFWDAYFVENDPFLHYFLAIALLRQNRDFILSQEQHRIPQTLSGLSFKSIDHLKRLLFDALSIRSRTPLCIRKLLHRISFRVEKTDEIRHISSRMSRLTSIYIPSSELVQQVYHDTLEDGSIKFVILDVRPQIHFENGHLPCAVHVSPDLLDDPEEMARVMEGFLAMRGCHFCLVGESKHEVDASWEGDYKQSQSADGTGKKKNGSRGGSKRDSVEDADTQIEFSPFATDNSHGTDPVSLLLALFLQRGFQHMSRCSGGFNAVHQAVIDSGSELIDHNATLCDACTPQCHEKSSGRLSSVRNFTSSFFSSIKKNIKLPLQMKLNAKREERQSKKERRRQKAEEEKKNAEQAAASETIARKKEKANNYVIIDFSAWRSDPLMRFFPCKRVIVTDGKELVTKSVHVLAVCQGYVIGLQPHGEERIVSEEEALVAAEASIRSKHRLANLYKIITKKGRPRLVLFHWKVDRPSPSPSPSSSSSSSASPAPDDVVIHSYVMDNRKTCIEAVKQYRNAMS